MPAAAPSGRGAPRAATARQRGAPAPPLSTTAAKRARPPTVDSSTLASSPLHRPTSDVIVDSDGPQRSPTKRSRTAAEAPAAPTTPAGHTTAPATPTTRTPAASTRTVPPAAAPLATTVPEDVVKICGIPDGHADALTTALSIVNGDIFSTPSKETPNPLTGSMFLLEFSDKPEPAPKYDYDESGVVLKGELHIDDETGKKATLLPGDSFFIHRGSTITFSTPRYAVAYKIAARHRMN
ncbi:hypothetical protein SEUCBS139899_002036 [Sporothrix eucalyptigena]